MPNHLFVSFINFILYSHVLWAGGLAASTEDLGAGVSMASSSLRNLTTKQRASQRSYAEFLCASVACARHHTTGTQAPNALESPDPLQVSISVGGKSRLVQCVHMQVCSVTSRT